MSELKNLRGLRQKSLARKSFQIVEGLDAEDIHMLEREVMRLRGELLFSKAIILFEGVTEEQIIPAMFQVYFGKSSFSLGISCISVAGKNYPPFVKMATSFGIPVIIVSDNDGNTQNEINSQIQKIRKKTNIELTDSNFFISFLSSGNDIEAEILNVLQMRTEVVDALVKSETRGINNPKYVQVKTDQISALNNADLLLKMRSSKASYAGFLSDIIALNENKKTAQNLIPNAVITAFEKLKEWGQL